MKHILILTCILITLATPSFAYIGDGADKVIKGVTYKTYIIEMNNWYVKSCFTKDNSLYSTYVEDPQGRAFYSIWKRVN